MEHTARFLPNRPIGEDLYDGQSQDRIASAIKDKAERGGLTITFRNPPSPLPKGAPPHPAFPPLREGRN